MFARLGAPLLALVVVCAPAGALAAQIVALDMKATGGVPEHLARSLSPLLVTELSRREGMSVISQSDVRALLELEADRQLAGCSDESCMTDIAGSLGAELLCTSTIGRVGNEYVVSLTLIQVEGAKVARRTTARRKGGEGVASEALLEAVQELFRGELPLDLQGPASMTGRGFEAALAGLHRAILDVNVDAKESRKRVILDLVATELDYDVEPKLDMLDLAIRRGRAEARRRVLGARDGKERDHYVRAMEQYDALWDDLGRVKEIRTRSRERGLVPSARPLRFLDPDPLDEPSADDKARYQRAAEEGRKIVSRALAAYQKGDAAAFSSFFKADYAESSKRELDNREYDAKHRYSYDVLPAHALPPDLWKSAVSTMNEGRLVVWKRRKQGGEVYDEDPVWLDKENGAWRISSW